VRVLPPPSDAPGARAAAVGGAAARGAADGGGEAGGCDGGVKSCPSAPCVEGAVLLGVKTTSGRIAYVQPPTRIDAEFVARVEAMGRPESRFRFSLPCSTSSCPQWTGTGCGVIDHVLADAAVAAESTRLPTCAIRRTCRWYAQRGADACAVCPLVVADAGGTETYRSTVAVVTSSPPGSPRE
jgi:hypothetical protein